MPTRVALLTNIPAPYRLPLFRLMALRYDFEVVFNAVSEPNRSWTVPQNLGFRHSYGKGFAIPYRRRRSDFDFEDERYLQVGLGVLPALRRIRPDVIVSAEMGLRTLQATLYASWTGTPLILWWEGTSHTEGWVSEKKRRVRRYIVRHAARFWANGAESATLLQEYGAPTAAIDQGMIGIDTHRFAEAVETRLPERDAIRQQLGVTGAVLLFVGRFVPGKGIDEFLRALELMSSETRAPFSVLLIGEGPKRAVLDEWRARRPQITLRIVDFQQPAALPSFYAAADIFVLPTLDDNWSLVALEAAVAGLPQVFSQYNGASSDLLARRAPGCTINPAKPEELALAMQYYVEHVPPRVRPAASHAIAEFYSPEACVRRAAESIDVALRSSRTARSSGSRGVPVTTGP
jgi:glycosyltransferase involved in cell wall biosynthesis